MKLGPSASQMVGAGFRGGGGVTSHLKNGPDSRLFLYPVVKLLIPFLTCLRGCHQPVLRFKGSSISLTAAWRSQHDKLQLKWPGLLAECQVISQATTNFLCLLGIPAYFSCQSPEDSPSIFVAGASSAGEWEVTGCFFFPVCILNFLVGQRSVEQANLKPAFQIQTFAK